jgi:DNA replication protein DnaC
VENPTLNPQESSTTQTPQDSEGEFQALLEIQHEQREAQGLNDPPEQGSVQSAFQKALSKLATTPCRSDSEIADRQEWEIKSQRGGMITDLLRAMGQRYSTCRLSTFQFHGNPSEQERQRAVVTALHALLDNVEQHVAAGGNVILYGPPGTGKDHLLASVLLAAIWKHGICVQWTNGQDLFGDFRDRIDGNRSEASLVGRFTSSQILAISDPAPPKGDATNYNAQMLYRIIDARYRHGLGTWISVNVGTEQEARESLSSPVFDRLMDNSVRLFCNWPSYRRTVRPQFA